MSILLSTDSYKFSHYKQYPPGTEQVYSYLESRGGKFKETVFFGLQILLDKYLSGRVVTQDKIDYAEMRVNKNLGPNSFNKEGRDYRLKECGGKLPISIKAVQEGSVVNTGNVLITVENTDPACYWLTNYLETLLVQIWYGCTVATQSREMKKILLNYLEETGTPSDINFKLHDFGYRGVSSKETAGVGGCAHLVNFKGSDNFEGVEYAYKYYDEDMAGFSIPACYDDKTEILTERGFILFKDLDSDDKVAQYNEDGTINFIRPSKNHNYYKINEKMVSFTSKTQNVNLCVTLNHRLIRKSIATQKLEVVLAMNARR